MLLVLAAILFLAWFVGIIAFHVAGGLIHVLVVLALISVIVHFVRGARSTG